MRTLKELFRMDGNVAIVTGGAGHIALACEEALAELGANILLVDRDTSALERRAADLTKRFNTRVELFTAQLEDVATVPSIVTHAITTFGRIDVLVNNAAYVAASGLGGYAVPFAEQSASAWEAALKVNLTVPFLLAQATAPELAKARGSIVNVGSIYGSVGPNLSLYAGTAMGNPAGYAATKGGLAQLTRYLATVLAPHVRVNCLSPGGVARGQNPDFVERYVAKTPLGRMAVEEDFKGAFALLVGPASAYITGQNLLVDGGWTAW